MNRHSVPPAETVRGAVQSAVAAMKEEFCGSPHIADFVELMELAVSLADSDKPDLEAIHLLGEGWVAEETLAIAIFCALRHSEDFDAALIAAVNHNGDSDSTGAVAGNILGTYLGYERIPEKYKNDLELRDTILQIADDLYNDCRMTEHGDYYDEVWVRKYIKMTYPERM